VITAEGKKIGVLEIPSFYVNLHDDVIKEISSSTSRRSTASSSICAATVAVP
jgi:carboxyl-terminal processing protease